MSQRKTLTAKFIANPPPPPPGHRHHYFWDDLVPGLGLRVSAKGHSSYVVYRRWPGTKGAPTRRSLGSTKHVVLAEARSRARDWLTQAANGHDPLAAVRAAKLAAARSQQASFATVAEAWFAAEVAQQRKGKRVIREMRRECFPTWGARPITAITTLDVLTLVKAKQAHAPQQVRNLLGEIQRLFTWAAAQHIYGLTNNPAALLRPTKLFGRRQARDRVLADDELRAVWAAAEQIGYPYGDVLKLLILTGQRRSEVAEARWGEFELTKRLWTIPAERMKTKAVHVVPLTKFVCKLLPTLPRFTKGDCVFSTTFGASPVTGFSQLREKLAGLLGDKVAPFVLHDLRRTMRTHLSALPIQDLVRELVIGHVQKGMHRVYDRHAYEAEKREALELWEKRLRAIVGG